MGDELRIDDGGFEPEDIEKLIGDEPLEFPEEETVAEEVIEEPKEEVVDEVVEEPQEVETEETVEVEEPAEETVEASDEDEDEVKEPNEVEALKQQNIQLMEMLNKVAAGQPLVTPPAQQQSGQSTPTGEPAPSEGDQTLQPPAVEEVDFSKAFDGVDFGEVLDSEEAFKGFMTNVLQSIYVHQQEQIQSVPQTVQQTVQQHESMRQAHNSFYETYPELSHVKNYVGQVAHDISVQNPAMEMNEVLTKTAETVKTGLGITSVEVKPEPKTPGKKPNLPGSKGTRKPQQKKSAQQSEIDDLITEDY